MSGEKTTKVEVELTDEQVKMLRKDVWSIEHGEKILVTLLAALPPEEPGPGRYIGTSVGRAGDTSGKRRLLFKASGEKWQLLDEDGTTGLFYSWGGVVEYYTDIRRLDLSAQPPDDVEVVEGFVFGWEAPGALGGKSCVMVYLDADPDGITNPVAVQLLIPRAKS